MAALVWYWVVRDSPKAHPWTSKKELATIEAGLPARAKESEARQTAPWMAILRNRSMMAMTFSYFAFGYVAWIFFTWFFTYLSRVRGLDLKSSSFFSMLPFIAMAGCSDDGRWIADILTKRYGKRVGRCGVALVGIGLAAVLVALATQGRQRVPNWRAWYWPVERGRLSGAERLLGDHGRHCRRIGRSASGLMNMGGQLGGALTASLTPWIADHFGLDSFVPGGRGLVRPGRVGLAAGGSEHANQLQARDGARRGRVALTQVPRLEE